MNFEHMADKNVKKMLTSKKDDIIINAYKTYECNRI